MKMFIFVCKFFEIIIKPVESGVILRAYDNASVLVYPGEKGGNPGVGLRECGLAALGAKGDYSDQFLVAIHNNQRTTAVTLDNIFSDKTTRKESA